MDANEDYFVLTTTDPNGLAGEIHPRMPVILPPEDYERSGARTSRRDRLGDDRKDREGPMHGAIRDVRATIEAAVGTLSERSEGFYG